MLSNKIADGVFKKLGLQKNNPGVFCGDWLGSGPVLKSISPIDGKVLGQVRLATAAEYERAMTRAEEAFQKWRTVPAPKRGEVIRQYGNALRDAKKDLGKLVTLETGKILAEGEGEVQEMIDICDFAVGLSRQLYGLTIAIRARAASHDGTMASARRRRNYQRLQFSRCRVGVEQRSRRGLRQFNFVEPSEQLR